MSVRNYGRVEAGSRALDADQRRELARVCDVPELFLEVDFAPIARPMTDVERRLHELEERLINRIESIERVLAEKLAADLVDEVSPRDEDADGQALEFPPEGEFPELPPGADDSSDQDEPEAGSG